MPRKIDPDRKYGQKVIQLFVRLLFSRRPHSLTELAEMLGCSKQSVLRLIRDIENAYLVEMERTKRGREAIFELKKEERPTAVHLSQREMDVLWMCATFTEHLVGKRLFEQAKDALYKSQTLMKDEPSRAIEHFASFYPGTIDYTPHQETIRTLIEAMNKKRVCKVTYKAASSERAKTFHIKPLKIFSYRDTLYLHALRAKDPWQKKWVQPEFDPLLAIHRFKKVDLADRTVPFEVPKNYDFEKAFNRTFGIIKEESFQVEAEFTGWAATYVAERMWSPDQEIKLDGDKVRIRFTASSESEVISWILSFGEQGIVHSPAWLRQEVSRRVGLIVRGYGGRVLLRNFKDDEMESE
jgi:predicted DNA-binding transcriptional regulator YafY